MRKIANLVLCVGLIFASVSLTKGQQFTIFNQSVYNPQFFNPSSMGRDGKHDVNLRNQLRKLNFEQASYSQFLGYSAAPFNSKRTMAWGATIQNDREFTERRLTVMANFAYHVLNDTNRRLSFGGGIGLINLGADYSNVPIYDPGDPLTIDVPNYTLPDVSMGIDFHLNKRTFIFDLGAAGLQLPGRFVDQTLGLQMVPHVMARSAFLLKSKDKSAHIGPMFLYKNVVLDTAAKTIGEGQLDANLYVEFPKKNLWFGGGYRFGNTAVNGAFGINLFNTEDSSSVKMLDLSANFEYPLNDSKVFGSVFEIGLSFAFGKKNLRPKENIIVKYIPKYYGPIWMNTTNLNYYIDEQWYDFDIDDIANQNSYDDEFREMITVKSNISDDVVILTFEYEENNLQYDLYQQDGARKLVDIVMNKVVRECLHPAKRDSQPTPDSLASVFYISLSSKFAFDSSRANTETAIKFGGDWDLSVVQEDFLYDGVDTTSYIVQGENVTNLELALLKLISLKKAFESRPSLREKLEKLQVRSDNPGQTVPITTKITIGFRKED